MTDYNQCFIKMQSLLINSFVLVQEVKRIKGESVKVYTGGEFMSRFLVWNEIAKLMSDPKLLQQQIMRWTSKKHGNSEVSGESAEQLKIEIEKIKKEEARYVKAFGAELITEEQLKEAMEDLKPKRVALERQVAYLENQKSSSDNIAVPSDGQIEEYAKRAKKKLSSLSFETKQAIIRKVVDTIIADQTTLRIRGYLPIKEKQNVESESESRNYRIT